MALLTGESEVTHKALATKSLWLITHGRGRFSNVFWFFEVFGVDKKSTVPYNTEI